LASVTSTENPWPGSPRVNCKTGRLGHGRSSRTRTAGSGSAIRCTGTRSNGVTSPGHVSRRRKNPGRQGFNEAADRRHHGRRGG
jgi:hypothetical protein